MKRFKNHLVAYLFCILTGSLILSPTAASGANTIYVGPSQLYTTIQDAIDAAADGDTVVVRDGTYKGKGNKNLKFGGKAITVRSESGPEACIIDCEHMGRAFTFENKETSSSVVDGFTITGGDAGNGAAVHCWNSSPKIANCIIKDNKGCYGGGLYCFYESSPTLINCIFSGNSACRGGGIYLYYGSSPTLIHCSISGNSAVKLESAGGEGGGIYLVNSFAAITNCIVWGNKGDEGEEIFVSSTSSPTIAFSALSGNWEGEGNIMLEDSPFVTDGDCHLKEDSSCIDKGTDKITLPEFDFEGDQRVLGSAPDMGADESALLARLAIKVDVRPGCKPNTINLKSKGVVPVAILTDGSFYLYALDIRSVQFAGAQWIRWKIRDVDHDGDDDLLFFFRKKDLQLTKKSTEATLSGVMFDGTEIHGTDKVNIVPRRKHKDKRKWTKHMQKKHR